MSFQFTMVQHEIGRLSRSGVLDIGLKCPHSCQFCYYSYLDGTDDQFRGMRQAPFRPLEYCKRALDSFASHGLERLDITGGEPLFHPDIVDIVRYAEKEKNLRVRMITLAQLFDRIDRATGRPVMSALLDEAEITEFLLSMHAVDVHLFHSITKGQFARLERAMDTLDERGFEYCTNTVVYAGNANHIPEIARYIVEKRRRVHISNFIVMNAYFAWSTGKAFGVQAPYGDLGKPLREAAHILEGSGIGVNIRNVPYCTAKGLERNIAGIRGVPFDPYEWRNALRNPFAVVAETESQALAVGQRELVSTNKVFVDKCKGCSLKQICDGVDANYIARYGDGEIEPYEGKVITEITHFRRANPRVFEQKQKRNSAGELMVPKVAQTLSSTHPSDGSGSLRSAVRKFYWNKLHRKVFVAEIPFKGVHGAVGRWTEAAGPDARPGRVLSLGVGTEVSFSLQISPRASVLLWTRVNESEQAGEERGSKAKMRVQVEGGPGERSLHSACVSVSSHWTATHLHLRNKDSMAVKLTLTRRGADPSRPGHVLCFEPLIVSRDPLPYITKLAYHNLMRLGPRYCYRRLLAYANSSDYDVKVDFQSYGQASHREPRPRKSKRP